MGKYYCLAPDIAVIRLKEGGILFKSDTLGIRLEGDSAVFLVERILPLLDGVRELQDVAANFPSLPSADLQQHLDQLVHAGVLICRREKWTGEEAGGLSSYYSHFLESLKREEGQVQELASNFRIALVGLDGHGTQTALCLQQAGMKNLILVDPWPGDEAWYRSFPFLREYGEGAASKQECLKRYLEAGNKDAQIQTGPELLTKESLAAVVKDSQLCIVCMDKGFSAIYYWVNQLSLQYAVPALYSSFRGHTCVAGPLVVPEKTACYMCYKMRNLATNENFDEGMSYEEHLNGLRQPAFADRVLFPAGIAFLGASLSAEAIKYAFALGPLSLADKVLELNALTFQSSVHSLLQKPDCPVCAKKKNGRIHLPGSALAAQHGPSRLGELLDTLVSSQAGVVKSLEPLSKDITEPKLPYIYVANLANHSFLPKEKYELLKCSGKGMDLHSARISAAGEAVERYSGTIYDPSELVFRSWEDMGGTALDPKRLVLYAAHQYADIPYHAYDASVPIGWMDAWSLDKDGPVKIPALGALLNYNMPHPREHLFQATSNGLAAGGSLLSAVLSAALEVIERDAFVISWHQKLPARRIRVTNHPSAEVRELVAAYARRGVDLRLFQLPTDAPAAVFMCVSVQERGEEPVIVVGLGCDLSPEKAARQAVLEVGQIRPAIRRRLRMPGTRKRMEELIAWPERVVDLEDHDLLYASSAHLGAFDFLFRQPEEDIDWAGQDLLAPAEQLSVLVDYCRSIGSDLIYCNLTPPDMEGLGLYTARVIIPDLQPIHFGWKHIRMGGDRLFGLPVKLGFHKDRVRPEELDLFPHPLA